MNSERRKFIVGAVATASGLLATHLFAQSSSLPRETISDKNENRSKAQPPHEAELVAEFVSAAHRDLERVKAMVAVEPKLVLAARDTRNVGRGDWETGLNGAAHTGNREIALFLLDHGARIDAFAAAMLGYREVVLALLKADPTTATIKGPHSLTLLYHAASGGDVVLAEAIKPLLPNKSSDFNQALSAAARDGHLEMTEWLLSNGASNVNQLDAFGRTPVASAVKNGHTDVATFLRAHGGK